MVEPYKESKAEMQNYQWQHELSEIAFYVVIGALATFFIPMLLMYRGGWDAVEYFYAEVSLYTGFVIWGFLIYFVFVIGKMATKGEKFEAISHDPERGVLGKFTPYFVKSHWRFTIICFAFFTVLTFAFALRQTFFSVSQSIYFQITPLAERYFGAEPGAFSENIFFTGIVLTIGMTLIKIGLKKVNMYNKFTYLFFSMILLLPILGWAWKSYHLAKFGGQELAIISVIIFAMVGGFLSIIFMSWIPWWAWHSNSNFFKSLVEAGWSSERIIILFAIALIFIYLPLLFLAFKKPEGKK